MGLRRITEPATTPVTLAQVKEFLRVTDSDSDASLNGMIAAATSFAEDFTGRSLTEQSWRLTLDGFADAIMLTRGPVRAITSVKYYDTAGVLTTLPASAYTLDEQSDPAFLVRNSDASWPATLDAINAVQIDYVTGYDPLPAALAHAVLLMVGHAYDNREGETAVPAGAMQLLHNHRAFA